MRVYLDDDLNSNLLIGLLRQGGHEVLSPRTAGTRGIHDDEHLAFATSHNAVLLTANALDFVQVHNERMTRQLEHPGILIVYRENNPSRDMNYYQIAKAVTRIEQSGISLASAFHNLNFWR